MVKINLEKTGFFLTLKSSIMFCGAGKSVSVEQKQTQPQGSNQPYPKWQQLSWQPQGNTDGQWKKDCLFGAMLVTVT